MDNNMRDILTFVCEGVTLVGTLDHGAAPTGLLVVSGGNEIRIGAHRGMARLAHEIARHGHPVFRFDRRGIGDSEGENNGFRSSGPDIAAAIAAFRAACPHIMRIVAFGNCDAATALVLHDSTVDARVLANPWIIEAVDDLPPAAAIKDRYTRRLRDPKAWTELLTGKIDLRALSKGLGRIVAPAAPVQALAETFAEHLPKCPTTILLAERDNTALAFAEAWKEAPFAAARETVRVVRLDSPSHSFASDADEAALITLLLDALAA